MDFGHPHYVSSDAPILPNAAATPGAPIRRTTYLGRNARRIQASYRLICSVGPFLICMMCGGIVVGSWFGFVVVPTLVTSIVCPNVDVYSIV